MWVFLLGALAGGLAYAAFAERAGPRGLLAAAALWAVIAEWQVNAHAKARTIRSQEHAACSLHGGWTMSVKPAGDVWVAHCGDGTRVRLAD